MATSKKVVRKKQTKAQETRVGRAVVGLLLVGVAVILLICFYVQTDFEVLRNVYSILWGLGGVLAVLLPIMILWLGLLCIFSTKSQMKLRRYLAVLFIVICANAMVQLFDMQAIRNSIAGTSAGDGFPTYVVHAFSRGTQKIGGGAIGAVVVYPLWNILPVWGALILLIIAVISAMLICTNTSLAEIAEFVGLRLGDARQQVSQWRSEKEEQRQQAQPPPKQERYVPMTEGKTKGARTPAEGQDVVVPPPMPAPEAPKKRGRKKKQPEPAFAQTPGYDTWQQPVGYGAAFGPAQDDAPPPPGPAYAQGPISGAMVGAAPFDAASYELPAYAADPLAYDPPPEPEPPKGASRVLAFPTGEEVVLAPPEPDPYEWTPSDLNRSAYVPRDWARAFTQDAPDEEALPEEGGAEAPPWDEGEEALDPAYDAQPSPSVPRRRYRLKKPPQRDAGGYAPEPAPSLVPGAARLAEDPPPLEEEPPRRLDGSPLRLPSREAAGVPAAPAIEYPFPPMRLLKSPPVRTATNTRAKDEANANKLIGTLQSFGVKASVIGVSHGPAITRFEVQPAAGVKVSRIVGLVDDIALNMAAAGVRIEAPIPGKAAVGIEIPNDVIETVILSEVVDSVEMRRQQSDLACALGRDIAGTRVIADLAKMPHLLIAGATGSGKSVCINTLILSLLYRSTPEQVRMILIDPKVVELSVYNGVPHLLVPVVTDPKKASGALSWAVAEMERRYAAFAAYGVRDIRGYNAMPRVEGEEPMALVLVVIDELADLMMVAPGEVEDSILRLAQKARAAGIHLVIATQRPSVNVITGVIKANIPSRIAFAVSSQVDSRTILDMAGAEKLLGKGDMLYAPQGAGKPRRVQGCFVSDEEVAHIVDYIKKRYEVSYNEDVEEFIAAAGTEEKDNRGAEDMEELADSLLPEAIEIAVNAGQVSISMLQRKLRIGYARAGRLVDEMARRGYVGEADGSKPRDVLITREQFYQEFGQEL